MEKLKFDEIGYWSEIKLDIIRDYAKAYSTILSARNNPSFYHIYIDAFAGAGIHKSKTKNEFVLGSPLNALNINPAFKEYHFIDLNKAKTDYLSSIIGEREDVNIYTEDCNEILLDKIFPKVKYKDYRRGLCILDPYGLHLDWRVIETAGKMKSIEIFLNFPVADMNRNVLWRNPVGIDEKDIERMSLLWGDDSWKKEVYSTQLDLFGEEYKEKRYDNKDVAEAFRKRLINIAGFKQVPEPMPMRNSKGAIIYYLFFASQKPVAENIVRDIFNKYKNRGLN